MALSNIGKEPRREITESFLGISAVAFIIWILGFFARWIAKGCTGPDHTGMMVLGYVVGIALLIVIPLAITGILVVTHGIGEIICDLMKDLNLDPRPKQRYR